MENLAVIASQCAHWRGNLKRIAVDSHVGLRPPRNDQKGGFCRNDGGFWKGCVDKPVEKSFTTG